MKNLTLLCLSILSFNLNAANIQIIGPCSEKPLINKTIPSLNQESIGSFTVRFLAQNKIPYAGSDAGMSSIFNTPVGDEALEVISDTKMRAYGWCFNLNGINPDKMPDVVFFTSNNDQLTWYYAFSTYDSGKWVDYCVPAYTVKSSQFCH